MTSSKSRLAERTKSVTYAIRDLVVEAQKLERSGKKVIYANIGDPLKYDFSVPAPMAEALCTAIRDNHNYYSDSQGDFEFRQAIAAREHRMSGIRVPPEDIVVTAGVSEAILLLTAALVERGDEVLLPGPSYPPYIAYTTFFSGQPVFYRTAEEQGWQPDIIDIEKKLTDKTKFLLLINPNNPTGAVYSRRTLEEMVNLAGQHNLTLVSDEVYDSLVFDKPHYGAASLTTDVPVIGFNGLSKGYLATGWRIGWAYFANMDQLHEEIKEAMLRLARVRLCPSTPAQKAAINLLHGDNQHLTDVISRLRERRDFSFTRLNEIDGISATKPEAAFYIFPQINPETMRKGGWHTDKEFVLDLLRTKHVLVVNGSGFGAHGENHFRVVYLPSMGTLSEVYDRIDDFVRLRTKT